MAAALGPSTPIAVAASRSAILNAARPTVIPCALATISTFQMLPAREAGQLRLTGKTIFVLVGRARTSMPQAEIRPSLRAGQQSLLCRRVQGHAPEAAVPDVRQATTGGVTVGISIESGWFKEDSIANRSLWPNSLSDGTPGMAVQARHCVTLFALGPRPRPHRCSLLPCRLSPAPPTSTFFERIKEFDPSSDGIRIASYPPRPLAIASCIRLGSLAVDFPEVCRAFARCRPLGRQAGAFAIEIETDTAEGGLPRVPSCLPGHFDRT